MYGTVGLDDGRPGAGQSGIEYLTAIIHECFPQRHSALDNSQ